MLIGIQVVLHKQSKAKLSDRSFLLFKISELELFYPKTKRVPMFKSSFFKLLFIFILTVPRRGVELYCLQEDGIVHLRVWFLVKTLAIRHFELEVTMETVLRSRYSSCWRIDWKRLWHQQNIWPPYDDKIRHRQQYYNTFILLRSSSRTGQHSKRCFLWSTAQNLYVRWVQQRP